MNQSLNKILKEAFPCTDDVSEVERTIQQHYAEKVLSENDLYKILYGFRIPIFNHGYVKTLKTAITKAIHSAQKERMK